MGQITLFMHISLDGFAAGPQGEMDWIHVDEEIFDHGTPRIQATEIALYGRKTFQMMEAYWPTAAQKPNPSRHDLEHSRWYKTARKAVLSRTLNPKDHANTQVIRGKLGEEIAELKKQTDREILVFGSPSAAHALMAENLIDQYWFNVNPVLLGRGVPVFKDIRKKAKLALTESKVFSSGVVCLSYVRKD